MGRHKYMGGGGTIGGRKSKPVRITKGGLVGMARLASALSAKSKRNNRTKIISPNVRVVGDTTESKTRSTINEAVGMVILTLIIAILFVPVLKITMFAFSNLWWAIITLPLMLLTLVHFLLLLFSLLGLFAFFLNNRRLIHKRLIPTSFPIPNSFNY
jgi:hypothetical protein